MQGMAATIDALKEKDRFATALAGQAGIVKDLLRDNVIVHVGKPMGSVTGWLGTFRWQVWLDYSDAAGEVRARIDGQPAQLWRFEPDLKPEVLLDRAKERLLEEVTKHRKAALDEAQERLGIMQRAAG
ncbi:hypothetical protein SAMN04244548_05406 [Paracoccus pantotrophus]|nr:hypothetical protein SAMN04244548_05406 [Paracoccus pantotrophus]